jgi:hypothetical protein
MQSLFSLMWHSWNKHNVICLKTENQKAHIGEVENDDTYGSEFMAPDLDLYIWWAYKWYERDSHNV